MKIQASAQKYHRGAGQPAPRVAKICCTTTIPMTIVRARPARSATLAHRGVIARSSPEARARLTCRQRHQP